MCIATKALGDSFPPASFLYLLPVDFWGWPCECCDIIFFCPLDRHSCSLKDLHLVWEGRFGCVCSLFIFPQLYCEDTFSDWLPECWLCLEFISQVTATGHFLRVAVINRTLGLVSWGSCNKDVQVVVTENVHKAAALLHAHPVSWDPVESEGLFASLLWNWVKFAWANRKGIEPHYFFHLKLLTKGPCRLIPSGSTVHRWGCLGARRHCQEGGILNWDPQLQQRLRPAEFSLKFLRVLMPHGTLDPATCSTQ